MPLEEGKSLGDSMVENVMSKMLKIGRLYIPYGAHPAKELDRAGTRPFIGQP